METNKTKSIVGGGVVILLVVTFLVFGKSPAPTRSSSILSEIEARAIAEASCIKGGEALGPGSYNEITKTWWFDANLNAAREGCNPVCVVSEETKTAEVNWRCAGLIEPGVGRCGIENCHGLNIVCGANPAEVCTKIYKLGDCCRQYAKCGVVDGTCRQIENSQFSDCTSCVKKCQADNPNDPDQIFQCESRCC